MNGLRALASKELRQLMPTTLALAVFVVLAPAIGLVAARSQGASEGPVATTAAALIMAALLLGATAGTGDAAPAFESARPLAAWVIAVVRLGVRAVTLAGLGVVGLTVLAVASSMSEAVALPPADVMQAIAWWAVATLMASALASAFARRPSTAVVHGAWMIGLLFLVTTPAGAVGSFAGLPVSEWLGALALAALVARQRNEASMRRWAPRIALAAIGLAAIAIAAFAATIAARSRPAHRELGRAWAAWEAVAPREAKAVREPVSDEPLRRLQELSAPLDYRQFPDASPAAMEKLVQAYFGRGSVNEMIPLLAATEDPSRVAIPDRTRDWLASEADCIQALTGFLLEEKRPILAAAATSDDEVVVPTDHGSFPGVLAPFRKPRLIDLRVVGDIERTVMVDALMAAREGDVERALRDVGAANRLCRELGDGLDDPSSRIALVSCHRDVLTVVRAMDPTTPVSLDDEALGVVRTRAMDGVVVAGRDAVRSGHAWVDALASLPDGGPSAWWSPLQEVVRRIELRALRSEEAMSVARELTAEADQAARLRDGSECDVAFLAMRGDNNGQFRDLRESAYRPSPPADDLTYTHFMLRRAARLELEAEMTRVVLATRAAPPAASDEVPSKLCPGRTWRRELLADGSVRISCWRVYEPDDWRTFWTVSLVHVEHPRRNR